MPNKIYLAEKAVLDEHINDVENPHGISDKIQDALDANSDLVTTESADEVEGEAPETNPLVLATKVESHINNISNPHNVTNVQIGAMPYIIGVDGRLYQFGMDEEDIYLVPVSGDTESIISTLLLANTNTGVYTEIDDTLYSLDGVNVSDEDGDDIYDFEII